MKKAKINFAALLTLLFIQSVFIAQAQKNPVSGYIVDLKGDTIQGFIEDKEWAKNPKNIRFRNLDSSDFQNLDVLSIVGFGTSLRHFVSGTVELETSPYKMEFLDKTGELKTKSDTLFLELVTRAKVGLYQIVDLDGKNHFYLEIKPGKYELLLYKKFIDDSQETGRLFHNNKFKQQISFYLNDCPDLKAGIERVQYNRQSLEKLINSYHKCMGIETQVKSIEPKLKFEKGITSGISITMMTFNTKSNAIEYRPFKGAEFDNSVNFTGGIFFNLVSGRKDGRLSFQNEIMYTKYDHDGYKLDESIFNGIESNSNFNATYIRLNNLFKYKLPILTDVIYVNLGISNGFLVSGSTFHNSTLTTFGFTNEYSGKALDKLRGLEQGVIFGIGGEYKKFALESRFEFGNGLSPEAGVSTPRKTISFLLKYRI